MDVYAHQQDTIDSLCWRHLGSSAAVEQTLLLNPRLAALGPELPMGTRVTLPDADPTPLQNNLIQLWD
jgi:phage tail protein X